MAKKDLEAEDIERKVLDLANAMERTRSAQAERDDVVVEMKHVKMSRLELLAEDLGPVFNDIPRGNEQFEFALTSGATPRLWIDMTSFVRMAADGREYEFVKDTRLGRTVLGRSDKRDVIGEAITSYVAERILERERMIEGDWIAMKTAMASGEESAAEAGTHSEKQTAASGQAGTGGRGAGAALLRFLVGIGAGVLALWLASEFEWLEPAIRWLREISG